MRVRTLIFAIIFLISRFFLNNPQPVFFDSPEYIARFSDPNFLQAIYSGHIPLHLGYILISWPIYQLFLFLGQNPLYYVLILQTILSFLGIIAFYKITCALSNKNVALISSIIISFLPLFWITNVSVMMEAIYIPFFFISLYFLYKYSAKNNLFNLLLFSLFWGLSFLTHSAILLWTPFILYFIYIRNRKKILRVTIAFSISLILFSFINSYFISILNNNILLGLSDLYLKELGSRANLNFSIISIAVIFRNFLIPLLRNNTSLVILLGFVSLFSLFKKNKQLFILSLLWIIPSLITNQWWDSLFFGRHALISSFAFAFLTSLLIYKHKFAIIIVIFYLSITTIPAMFLLKTDIPYLVLKAEVQKLPSGGLYIESHFARPQLDKVYSGNQHFVDEPSYATVNLKDEIDITFKENKPVFISSQALSEPYGLYSGPYLHNLALSYRNDFVLKDTLENYSLKPYLVINKEDNLIIYKIKSIKRSPYPEVKSMKKNKRRLDYYDPLFKLWLFFYKK
ncbi:MAG: glycosyltransferase family 39 protein [Candidatus Levyibacteriota bacterium]